MLHEQEKTFVHEHAYLPEHVSDYVTSVTRSEPFLHESYLCYVRRGHLIFIGYPLGDAGVSLEAAYESACERFDASTVAIIAPEIRLPGQAESTQPSDRYYRLDLPVLNLSAEVAYMVRRGRRDLSIHQASFARQHKKMVKAFLSGHDLSRNQRKIYERIPKYLKRSSTALLIEARRGKDLAAFIIADLGAADYAFYMFSIRSFTCRVPGASDLLFYELTRLAHREQKRFLNLGLGVNPGVRKFKEKWGSRPFIDHASSHITRAAESMDALMKKL